MIQIKKTLLTLVALLAVTTGAWAQEQSETIATTANNVEGTHFTISNNDDYADSDGMTAKSGITVTPKNGETITKVVISCTWDPGHVNNGNTSVSSGTKEITNGGGTITVTGVNASTFTFTCSNGDPQFGQFVVYYTEAAASSGPEVAWDKATKTGTFTMPGGNVTLEPEYYPQAAVADGGVTAADADARATTDDPLVKVDATKLTGAKKLMYFVSNSGTTAPAYDAEGWTDQLPTAEGFTQQGIVYVWYYPVGTDEGVDGATATYSDGDICLQSITARIAAEPTYAVTFAEGTEESDKWSASPAAGVKKGQTVTVTYTGTKKVIGVKAEKKASTPTLKDALADGATVVINCVWDGETTFTYTNNGGNYTGSTTGYDAAYFSNGMSKDGTTLKFTASNLDLPQANVSIDFFTDSNEYYFNSKGDAFDSFTISVNGTDITSQLTEVK